MDSPNMVKVASSVLKSIVGTRRPAPAGSGSASADRYAAILTHVAHHGPGSLVECRDELEAVIAELSTVTPDRFGYWGALGYWLDLYNAGALALAARTDALGASSVLRVPGAFTAPFVAVAGENLSLDAIEHGKVRRFGDPRVHAALVCGSVSCPVLAVEPFSGADLDAVLDDHLTGFLATGGAAPDAEQNVLRLSRIFGWFSGDFVRPERMPTLVPASAERVVERLLPFLDHDLRSWVVRSDPRIEFESYDWGLRCSVGS